MVKAFWGTFLAVGILLVAFFVWRMAFGAAGINYRWPGQQ